MNTSRYYHQPERPLSIKGVKIHTLYGSASKPLIRIDAPTELLEQIEKAHHLKREYPLGTNPFEHVTSTL